MTNILSTNPNRTLPRKSAAVALIAASALSLTSCDASPSPHEGAYMECVGSQPYEVKPGDTLNEILLKHTGGVTKATVNDLSAELGRTDKFDGPGELTTVYVYHWAADTPKPEPQAGQSIDIPQQCET